MDHTSVSEQKLNVYSEIH